MTLRLAVSPLSWVNEVLPEFGAGTSATRILTEARAAGYTGVEMSRAFPRDPMALKSLLDRHGLSLASGWHNGMLADCTVEEELRAVADHARLLRHCGAKVMVYGECGRMAKDPLDCPMSHRITLAPTEWAAYGERLTHFAESLKRDHGLDLVYHHHLMMVAETLAEIHAVMNATDDAVGLLLDTGHAAAAGFDYAQLIRAFGPRIRHIHLKDIRAEILDQVRRTDLSFNDAVRNGLFTVPGDGSVDFTPLADFLKSGAYSGWLVVEAEQNPMLAPPAATVAKASTYMNNLLSGQFK